MMEPISLVVAALAAGALAGTQSAAAQAVQDAYAKLKHILRQRYSDVSTSGLEKSPTSAVQQEALAENLPAARVNADDELLKVAQALLDEIRARDPQASATAGVILNRIRAGSLETEGIRASGGATALRAEYLDVRGDVKFRNIEADGSGSTAYPQ
jgi:hypothetical protein